MNGISLMWGVPLMDPQMDGFMMDGTLIDSVRNISLISWNMLGQCHQSTCHGRCRNLLKINYWFVFILQFEGDHYAYAPPTASHLISKM